MYEVHNTVKRWLKFRKYSLKTMILFETQKLTVVVKYALLLWLIDVINITYVMKAKNVLSCRYVLNEIERHYV
jgi:hypothetical protein